MTVDFTIALCTAEFDARTHNFEGEACLPKFAPDCEALHFYKIRKIANPQTRSRLVTYVSYEMRCGKIVAIKLLVIRTFLFGHVHSAADRHNTHHVIQRARNGNGEPALVSTRLGTLIIVVDRSFFLLPTDPREGE